MVFLLSKFTRVKWYSTYIMQRIVNLRNLTPTLTKTGVWFKRSTLVTDQPDEYNTVIQPDGFVGKAENIIADNDHLFKDTKARYSNAEVIEEDGVKKLVADLYIPFGKAQRHFKDGKTELITEGNLSDLTGLSIYFSDKAYREYTTKNEFGRTFYNRYTIPYTSLLFGLAQGQQLASLGEKEFEEGLRTLQLSSMNTLQDPQKRCFCMEYLQPKRLYVNPDDNSLVKVLSATETEVRVINLSTDEETTVTPDSQLWEKFEPLDTESKLPFITESVERDLEAETEPTNEQDNETQNEVTEESETERACKPCDAQKKAMEMAKKRDDTVVENITDIVATNEDAPVELDIKSELTLLTESITNLTTKLDDMEQRLGTIEAKPADPTPTAADVARSLQEIIDAKAKENTRSLEVTNSSNPLSKLSTLNIF